MDKRFFQTTGLNQTGHYKNMPFADYLEEMRSTILSARHFIPEEHEKLASLNSPYALPNEERPKKGLLMIHGLLETPFITRDLASHFNKEGFEVRSILLPGHGTVPADLLNVSYEAWIDTVKYAIRDFQKTTDDIYLCGISTGGMLAINEAIDNDEIRGLFLLAPANQMKTGLKIFSPFVSLHKYLCRIFPFLKWLGKFPENDSMKYQTCAVNGGIQLYKLTKHVNERLAQKKLKTPIWMAVTADDETLNSKASIDFFHQQTHPDNRLLIFTNKNNHYKMHNIECVKSAVPDENIVNVSHLGIANSPENTHYGKDGDYTVLCHRNIKADRPVFGAINDAEKLWRDTKGKVKTKHDALYRLHYNPHFDKMTESISAFLKNFDL